MASIEITFIDDEKSLVINEINSLGYGFDYEYPPYSNNSIVINDIALSDKENLISFLKAKEISWS